MSVSAIDAIARACFRSFASLPHARVVDAHGVSGVMTDVPLTFFNGIAESRLDNERVANVIHAFRSNDRPFRWWISPSAEPSDLEEHLVAHGMQHRFDSAGMVADLRELRDAPPPRELTITRGEMDPWIDVFLTGFHKPQSERDLWLGAYAHCNDSWIHFVGYVDDQPVATTSVLLAGELAGVYHVVTLPEFRGRGIGAAMTREAMRVGRDAGARTAVLQSSEMGESVYRSVGFERVCDLRLFDFA